MPSRNVLKIDIPDSYYHVYARGASRLPVFRDDEDFKTFISMFRRYLSPDEILDNYRSPYPKLHEGIEVLAYCLMNNHFHIMMYQVEAGYMQRLMRGVMTAYSHHFNSKYSRSGSLFESRYKASRISSDEYLMHISRYVHLNPDAWQSYAYSSLAIYQGDTSSDWVKVDRVLDLFPSRQAYLDFVADYKDVRDELEAIKHELAGY